MYKKQFMLFEIQAEEACGCQSNQRMVDKMCGNITQLEGQEENQTGPKEYLESYKRLGSVSSVARECKRGRETVRSQLHRIAARSGFASIQDLLPEGMVYTRNEEKPTSQALHEMIVKQRFRCALSGVKLKPKHASLDHKLPVAKGGSDLIDNLQWVSTKVNRAKGTMTDEEFIEMCQAVANWVR